MTYTLKTQFATYENCHLSRNSYRDNGRIYLELWNEEDGPIAVLTVNIPGCSMGENETALDTNNLPTVTQFVEENGIGEFTGRYARSGYCTYPIYKIKEA